MDYIKGLDDMGGREDFPTEMLEWRIGRTGVIDYTGDLMSPPDVGGAGGKKGFVLAKGASKKTIRGGGGDDSDDDD